MAWRYIIQRALSGEILDWDLPLKRDGLSWALSGAGSLTGTISPDDKLLRNPDGSTLVIEEWGTFIYAEADGEIRWGGIIISSNFSDDEWRIEAAGFTTYPNGIPYLGEYSEINLDPANAVKELWRHAQSFPDSNLNVTVTADPTKTILGTPALSGDGTNLDPRTGQVIATGTTVEASPYELNYWTAKDCGTEISALAKLAPFDFTETHYWDGDVIRHRVNFVYPRVGRRRDDLAFVQGDNVSSVIAFTGTGDDFANEVYGIGAGEGRAVLHRATAVRNNRLRRVAVYTDKAVVETSRLDALIAEELRYRMGKLEVTSISVIDHPNAQIGSWQLGDDILISATVPWLGDVDLWCRVIGWSLTDEHTASLSLARSDSFFYGGAS